MYSRDTESPQRIDPNKVLQREREVAADQNEIEAMRRQNYEGFRRNLEKAFHEYDADGNQVLSRAEFKKFIVQKASAIGHPYAEETIDQLFDDMDVNRDGAVDKVEFLDMQVRAFRNCEDNIEFISRDIKDFDERIKEIDERVKNLKERDSGQRIEGQPIMKGSSLTFNIQDGEFDDQFFDPAGFEPMIEILVNENEQGTASEQVEHTRVVRAPLNMTPEWKEVLTFDIARADDEVAIQIINNFQN